MLGSGGTAKSLQKPLLRQFNTLSIRVQFNSQKLSNVIHKTSKFTEDCSNKVKVSAESKNGRLHSMSTILLRTFA